MKEIPFELSLQIEERILTVKYGKKDTLEKEMATHSNILTWEIPWTEELGGLQSMGLQKSQTQLSN